MTRFLSLEGRADDKDLVHIRGSNLEVEHLRYDPIADIGYTFFANLAENGTVIPQYIEYRSLHPFILEQPTEANGYRATVYLSDCPQPGYSWWRFELYYIAKTPDELAFPGRNEA